MYKIITRAMQIQKTLGTRRAAGYLRNKGISLYTAWGILLHKGTQDHYLNAE